VILVFLPLLYQRPKTDDLRVGHKSG